MSYSNENGIQLNEDELLASLDWEHMTQAQKDKWKRIMEVNKIRPYHTIEEIAEKLKVDERTIARDCQFIKKFIADRWIDELAHTGYSQMTMDFTSRCEDNLRKLYVKKAVFELSTDEVGVELYLKILAEIDKIEVMLVEMTGAGPALQSMKKAMREEKAE